MSVRSDAATRKDFFKQMGKGLAGAVILLIMLGIWLGWEGIYVWFYNKVVVIPKAGRIGDPLIYFWLILIINRFQFHLSSLFS